MRKCSRMGERDPKAAMRKPQLINGWGVHRILMASSTLAVAATYLRCLAAHTLCVWVLGSQLGAPLLFVVVVFNV